MGCEEGLEWHLLVASMGGHGEFQTGYFWFYEDGTIVPAMVFIKLEPEIP